MTPTQDALERVREAILAGHETPADTSVVTGYARQEILAALAEIGSYVRELEGDNARFHRHVEEMIEPKLLAYAERVKAECNELREQAREDYRRINRAEAEVARLREALEKVLVRVRVTEEYVRLQVEMEEAAAEPATHVIRTLESIRDSLALADDAEEEK